MTARTFTTAPCERLVVRYRRAGGGWQADRVLPLTVCDAEMKAHRRLRELRAAGLDAEILRFEPII